METRQIHVRDLSTVTGIQQYEHCVQSIFFLGLEDFEGTIYLSLESDKFSENVALTNNTFIIGQPMTKFNVTYTCQIYGIVGTGEKIQLSKQFRMAVYKSNNISGEAGEYPIDPNVKIGIDKYVEGKETEIDEYVDDVIQSIPSDYTELSNKVSAVTETEVISTVFADKQSGTETLPTGFSSTTGYLRNMTVSGSGNLSSTTNANNNTFWILAEEDMDVYAEFRNGAQQFIGIFENQPYGSANRVSPIYSSNDANYPMPTADNPLSVESGQYITLSYYNGVPIENCSWTLYSVESGETKLASSQGLTSAMKEEVDEKIHDSQEYLANGYVHLPINKWARHAWTSGGSNIDNRDYRVRYTEPIAFDHREYIVMEKGFTVAGYEDGVVFDSTTIKEVLPNVEYKIYVRRYVEDASEIADVTTFANALNISTALSLINIYAPTFTDVSMFERMGIGGDSYAAGGGIISGITSLTWGKNLERQAGITVDIYARSGQTVVGWVTDATRGLPALLNGAECGLYWLQHGINGTRTPEELGTAEDMSTYPHPATFYGQYVEAIEQIKSTFPNARIILATIIGSNFGLYQSTYENVNTAIKDIAEYCEVMLVDVKDDEFYRSPWYPSSSRSNHPTAMLCAGIAMANRRLISKCIQDNPDYFVDYGSNW